MGRRIPEDHTSRVSFGRRGNNLSFAFFLRLLTRPHTALSAISRIERVVGRAERFGILKRLAMSTRSYQRRSELAGGLVAMKPARHGIKLLAGFEVASLDRLIVGHSTRSSGLSRARGG